MVGFILWLLLLVFCWPLALLALLLWPLVWLLSCRSAGGHRWSRQRFALLRALVFLPARVLGRAALSLLVRERFQDPAAARRARWRAGPGGAAALRMAPRFRTGASCRRR